MANKITGRIIVLTPTETLTSRSGSTYQKREVVIERTVFDRNTGQPATDPADTPIFRVFGPQATDLDSVAVGDMITVHYDLEGRSYLKDGVKAYFTDVRVYRIEPAQKQAVPAPAPETPPQQAGAGTGVVYTPGPTTTHKGIAPSMSHSMSEDELPF